MQVRVVVALRAVILGPLILGLSAGAQTGPSQQRRAQQAKADCEALQRARAWAAVHEKANEALICSSAPSGSLACLQATEAAARAQAEADQQAEKCRQQGLPDQQQPLPQQPTQQAKADCEALQRARAWAAMHAKANRAQICSLSANGSPGCTQAAADAAQAQAEADHQAEKCRRLNSQTDSAGTKRR